MQLERHPMYLRFQDEAAALTAAKMLGFIGDDATELPKDGWFAAADGNSYYYCIDVCFGTGIIYEPTGEVVIGEDGMEYPVMAEVPGFHINGLWCGPIEQCPDFGSALLDPPPSTPAVSFG